MEDYGYLVHNIYKPIKDKYQLVFAQLDENEMFLIGKRFALYVFVDPRDGSNTWYVSIDENGDITVYTLDYIFADRIKQDDREKFLAVHGQPNSFRERVIADIGMSNVVLLNHCHDILSGDKQWLTNYPDRGDHSRHISKFLAPYFQRQGYYVKSVED